MIKNEIFSGERPLYRQKGIELAECSFTEGESAVKEGRSISSVKCSFDSKYPFWHCRDIVIDQAVFVQGARAAIWYSHNIQLKNSKITAPKIFRDASHILIENTEMTTEETLWDCDKVTIKNTRYTGEYVLFHSTNVSLENFSLEGKYSFQHTKNLEMRNSRIKSKDAFWNGENITVYDSVLEGEYLGWYSKNLKLVNCTIIGEQPLCYCEHLILENCKMIDTDLCFELSDIHASVTTTIDSVKNPKSGYLSARGIKELIIEESEVDKSLTKIEVYDEL